jgi:type IV secretory pathway VirB4 component
MTTSKPATPTQAFVPVKEIRNGVIILKDGGYRGVLMCSSINFALKSVDEQRAITQGFQNFLNTLDFSIQIVVNSRKMDLRPYLSVLGERMPDQKTELLRLQLREYIEFVRSLAEQTNIMAKSFYIIVPYSPRITVGQAANIFHKAQPADPTTSATFEEDRMQLEQRMMLVASGIAGTGVRAVPLGTEEIIELLYRSFNPGELENPIRLEQ